MEGPTGQVGAFGLALTPPLEMGRAGGDESGRGMQGGVPKVDPHSDPPPPAPRGCCQP